MSDIKSFHSFNKSALLFYGLIVLLIVSRMLPHPSNFTPIGAIGLFIGAYSRQYWQWLIPLCALLISDYIIGSYHIVSMAFVYLGFFASSVVGLVSLRNRFAWSRLVSGTFFSALLFFVLSNFGVWLSGVLYPMTLDGLSSCFIAAIPFFGNTLAGYFLYTIIIFGIYNAFDFSSEHSQHYKTY